METTVSISAADVNKLRQQTGAGMMDCKKALTEANGDFEKAIDYLRKKGQKVALNRSDRDAKEGFVFGTTNDNANAGAIISLNCETDFVAKNEAFIQYGTDLLNLVLNNKIQTIDNLLETDFNGMKVKDSLFEQIGKIGEKLEVSRIEFVESASVTVYNHPGNRLTSLIAFNQQVDAEMAKDVAMQAAAMAPVAIDKDDVSTEMLEREMDIARDQARQEGKPEDMVEKIAAGKVNKFYKESTLLNQNFIKDDKKTIRQLLEENNKDLKVVSMKRVQLAS
ncbi:MAG TPA: translation elongation factor Ts [Bacteroidia bacterium]|nr:translation elongation factor Ts [Bacteroidia bacterium]HNT80508.1 translation elongation factor Ts [Bacteroidia bacterium]